MSGQDKYNIRIISTPSAKVRSTPVMVVLELLNKMRENKVIHSAMLSENASASFVIHFKALLDCRDMLLESLNENSTNVVASALAKLNTLILQNKSWDPRYEKTVAYVLSMLIEQNEKDYNAVQDESVEKDYNAVQDQSKSRFRRTLAYRPNLTHPQPYRERYLRSIA